MAIAIVDPNAVTITKDEADMARYWNAKELGLDKPKPGVASNAVLEAWVKAGKPEVDLPTVAPKFAKGDARMYRAWIEFENYEDTEDAKALWFSEGKPVPDSYNDASIVATIFARRIGKNGKLTRAKEVKVNVSRDALQAVRGSVRGRPSTTDYVLAVEAQLEDLAPVRIVTAAGATHMSEIVVDEETGEESVKFNWTSKADANETVKARLEAAEQEITRLRELLSEAGIEA